MQLLKYIDTPFTWALLGFIIGVAFGVNSGVMSIGVWLVAAGIFGILLYMRLHGNAQEDTEGKLFAAIPLFIVLWMVGFIVRSFIF